MRTFLVERFTAKRFLFRFLRSKNEKRKNKFEIKKQNLLSQKQSWRDVLEKEWILKLMLNFKKLM
ncbi:hypothetical protein OBK01_08075 [Empedobacter falsenii]